MFEVSKVLFSLFFYGEIEVKVRGGVSKVVILVGVCILVTVEGFVFLCEIKAFVVMGLESGGLVVVFFF